jgi:anaerobic carbon-monoxide dehydrogenase iron sulfur subunit
MGLKFIAEQCIGCKLCQLACAGTKHNVYNPLLARLSVTAFYKRDQLCVEGRVCTLCGTCVKECPVEAITLADGALRYDADVCTSCNLCVEACPEKVIVALDTGVAICDLCGGDPSCVRWCPHQALVFEEVV